MSDPTPPTLELEPGAGVGPVRLGMTRAEVAAALASIGAEVQDGAATATMDYAFRSSLQIEYDDQGRVRFVGVGWYSGCGCDYRFRDRHLGDYPAEELFARLAELDGGEHTYAPAEYAFPGLGVNLWDADPQYDYRGGESRAVWGQVGVAAPRRV